MQRAGVRGAFLASPRDSPSVLTFGSSQTCWEGFLFNADKCATGSASKGTQGKQNFLEPPVTQAGKSLPRAGGSMIGPSKLMLWD